MAVKIGKDASIRIGTYCVAEMGTWSLDGIAREVLDETAFGDTYTHYGLGLGSWGGLSFSGYFDMTDSTGQLILQSALDKSVTLTSIRLYIDNTSYYTPNTNVTSSGGDASAGVLINNIAISFDQNGIGAISFGATCTGEMILI